MEDTQTNILLNHFSDTHPLQRISPSHLRIKNIDSVLCKNKQLNDDLNENSEADSSMVEQTDESCFTHQTTTACRKKTRMTGAESTDASFTFAFSVGNKIEQLSKLKVSRTKHSCHRRIWQFFVSSSGRQDCVHFIEKVVIELPGKDNPRLLTLSHPFEFSATAEIEEIPYEIHWRIWTRQPKTVGVHQMGYGKNGNCESLTTQFSIKAFQDYLRRGLKECMR